MPLLLMPRLSDSMQEGTILKWLVAAGASVTAGQEVVEIETDKASAIHEADADGPIAFVAAEGDTCAVGEVIATIGDAPELSTAPAAPTPDEREPRERTHAGDRPGQNGRTHQHVSPVARRLARQHGIDVTGVRGSGPRGRVLKADVIALTAATADGRGGMVHTPLTRAQQVVARRMTESRATVPDFTLLSHVDMEQAVALRGELKAATADRMAAPSFNDMVIKACGLALRAFPRVNGAYRDGAHEGYGRVNVGVAVAARDALLVPTVFDADTRSLGDIAATTRDLAARARADRLTPQELSAGTFTVSNLGMYGVDALAAVVNAPQAAILATGTIAPRAVVRDGALVAHNTMTVTLSCDHRVLNGAEAAEFLARVRELLERPFALVV